MDILLSLKQNGPFIIIYKYMDMKIIKKLYRIKVFHGCLEILFKYGISLEFCRLLYKVKSRFDLFKRYAIYYVDKLNLKITSKTFDNFDSYLFYKYMKHRTEYYLPMLFTIWKEISNENKYLKKIHKEHNVLYNIICLKIDDCSIIKYAKENNFEIKSYSMDVINIIISTWIHYGK